MERSRAIAARDGYGCAQQYLKGRSLGEGLAVLKAMLEKARHLRAHNASTVAGYEVQCSTGVPQCPASGSGKMPCYSAAMNQETKPIIGISMGDPAGSDRRSARRHCLARECTTVSTACDW